MATPSNHWKLGLFVVTGVTLAIATIVLLSARSLHKETTQYVTYFDESVQGLEIGSPVKYRGVTIGNVSAVNIAQDRRHVEIVSELTVQEIRRLGLESSRKQIEVPSDLRMQLESSGLTGVKFLLIDFFDEKANPPPDLPFPTPKNYIPAAVSVMKNLEDSVVRAVNRIPEVTDEVVLLIRKVHGVVADIDEKKFPERIDEALVKANAVLARVQNGLDEAHVGRVSREAEATLVDIRTAVGKIDRLADKLAADDGVYMSVRRASDAVGDAAASAAGAGGELEETLRAVQGAAASIQRLADALETDSDMLLKGRARRAP